MEGKKGTYNLFKISQFLSMDDKIKGRDLLKLDKHSFRKNMMALYVSLKQNDGLDETQRKRTVLSMWGKWLRENKESKIDNHSDYNTKTGPTEKRYENNSIVKQKTESAASPINSYKENVKIIKTSEINNQEIPNKAIIIDINDKSEKEVKKDDVEKQNSSDNSIEGKSVILIQNKENNPVQDKKSDANDTKVGETVLSKTSTPNKPKVVQSKTNTPTKPRVNQMKSSNPIQNRATIAIQTRTNKAIQTKGINSVQAKMSQPKPNNVIQAKVNTAAQSKVSNKIPIKANVINQPKIRNLIQVSTREAFQSKIDVIAQPKASDPTQAEVNNKVLSRVNRATQAKERTPIQPKLSDAIQNEVNDIDSKENKSIETVNNIRDNNRLSNENLAQGKVGNINSKEDKSIETVNHIQDNNKLSNLNVDYKDPLTEIKELIMEKDIPLVENKSISTGNIKDNIKPGSTNKLTQEKLVQSKEINIENNSKDIMHQTIVFEEKTMSSSDDSIYEKRRRLMKNQTRKLNKPRISIVERISVKANKTKFDFNKCINEVKSQKGINPEENSLDKVMKEWNKDKDNKLEKLQQIEQIKLIDNEIDSSNEVKNGIDGDNDDKIKRDIDFNTYSDVEHSTIKQRHLVELDDNSLDESVFIDEIRVNKRKDRMSKGQKKLIDNNDIINKKVYDMSVKLAEQYSKERLMYYQINSTKRLEFEKQDIKEMIAQDDLTYVADWAADDEANKKQVDLQNQYKLKQLFPKKTLDPGEVFTRRFKDIGDRDFFKFKTQNVKLTIDPYLNNKLPLPIPSQLLKNHNEETENYNGNITIDSNEKLSLSDLIKQSKSFVNLHQYEPINDDLDIFPEAHVRKIPQLRNGYRRTSELEKEAEKILETEGLRRNGKRSNGN